MLRRTLLLAASVFLVPLTAGAVCGREPPIAVWPHRGVAVPTNPLIAISAPAPWRGLANLALYAAPGTRRGASRGAGADADGIKLTPRFSWNSGHVARLELAPQAPLEPRTSYELRSGHDEILGVFTTSVLADHAAPTWPGLTKGRLGRPSNLECGSPLVELEGRTAATDDQTQSDDIRYELWVGTKSKPIDYAGPPLTWSTVASDYRTTPGFVVRFGNTDDALSDFELPPAKDRPLVVGVKALDLAGNASPPSELTLP